jgi:hypothetical protein
MKYELPEKFDVKANIVSKVQAEQAVLIVGHPMTDYRRVEAVLQGVGMLPAQKTRQQGLEPSDISAHLLKRAGVVPNFSVKIEQVAPSPIWQILALDLFMGNSDTGFWGWSDPQCIYLLDYWHATDPAMRFIFVYDSLEHVLVRASAGRELSREAVNQLINEWQFFYTALMHFYHRHRDCCLLVHAEQACTNPEAFDKALSSCLQRPLERDASASVVSMALDLLEASLAASMVQEQHAWRCSYEELQSQADFPLSIGKATDSLAAWNGFSALTMQMRLYGEALVAAEDQIAKTGSQLEVTKGHKAEVESRLNKQQKEAELLLLQLHQVQEELERHFLENSKLKQEGEMLNQSLAEARATAQTQRAALQRQFDEIKALAEANGKDEQRIAVLKQQAPQNTPLEVQQENELLLLQLHQVQEELERYYLENQQLKQQVTPQSKQGGAKRPMPHYGAAEHVKRQLSYRLGAVMITQSKSFTGWLGMPSALLRAAREYDQDKKHRSTEKLPRLSQYADSYEGERVKRHLSYRLGTIFLANYRSPIGLIKLPWLISKQVHNFRHERATK